MENFKLGRYLLLISLAQFLAIFIFGNVRENGDIRSALLYPVVYLLPAVLFHFIHGFLLVYFIADNRTSRFLLLLLIPVAISLVLNEWLQPPAYPMYRCVILATVFINGLYFFCLVRRSRAHHPLDIT